MRLSLAYSPCPNDTFIFDALVHGRIDTEDLEFDVTLADVEELNQRASNGEMMVTKLSYNAFRSLRDKYELLNAGSALGRGVGPLLVRARSLRQSRRTAGGQTFDPSGRIAIPGRQTTAFRLLQLAYPAATNVHEVLFSDIEDRVLSGEFDTGLLIHENRFTYEERGLEKIRDLGEFWEETTGLPIPLGGIVARKDLGPERIAQIDRLLRASVQYAFDHPEASADYVAAHAQEMDPEVRRRHIALYVNDFTLDLGPEGRRAVTYFLEE